MVQMEHMVKWIVAKSKHGLLKTILLSNIWNSFGCIKSCKLEHCNYSIHMRDAIFQIANWFIDNLSYKSQIMLCVQGMNLYHNASNPLQAEWNYFILLNNYTNLISRPKLMTFSNKYIHINRKGTRAYDDNNYYEVGDLHGIWLSQFSLWPESCKTQHQNFPTNKETLSTKLTNDIFY
jgi:hypothetical protein